MKYLTLKYKTFTNESMESESFIHESLIYKNVKMLSLHLVSMIFIRKRKRSCRGKGCVGGRGKWGGGGGVWREVGGGRGGRGKGGVGGRRKWGGGCRGKGCRKSEKSLKFKKSKI